MIISASRRTDIPAFYSKWLINRIRSESVNVRNPFNPKHIKKISLKKEDVDCFVFWTKDPVNMMDKLEYLKEFHYYFLFTLNPYSKDIERNLRNKEDIISTFQILSKKIGTKRIIWRYDPILLTDIIDMSYHINQFRNLAKHLHNYTGKCIISFIDLYRKTQKNTKNLNLKPISDKTKFEIVKNLNDISSSFNIKLQICAEKLDFSSLGIKHGKCIDSELISELRGEKIESKKDKNQRKDCKCVVSTDIGTYNTCSHNCLYCYANYNQQIVKRNRAKHNVLSPFLIS